MGQAYLMLLLTFHWPELSHVTTATCRSLGIVVQLDTQEEEVNRSHFCQTSKRKSVGAVSGAVVHRENVNDGR